MFLSRSSTRTVADTHPWIVSSLFTLSALLMALGCGESDALKATASPVDPVLAAKGKEIFRFDTFEDESFWTGTLKMNEVIQPAVDPTTALSVGCHSGPAMTDATLRLHDAREVVSEPEPNGAPSYASRSATQQYRTAPLHGIWQHPPYFHNGSAATLDAVVEAYDSRKALALTAAQKSDLVHYLKSL